MLVYVSWNQPITSHANFAPPCMTKNFEESNFAFTIKKISMV
jgi:hypothetical protein